MKDRLLKFMQSKNISAGKLAEIIGVQPSAISHILSGRNKPGFDFLANLFNQFPDLNPRWMIVGEGNMIVMTIDSAEKKELPVDINNEILTPSFDVVSAKMNKGHSKSIERIAIFYTDGTFSSYEQQ